MSGDIVPLREYLEHVWAAVSNEALSMIFKDADAAGLEPNAHLTAMWLWTLGIASPSVNGKGAADEDTEEESVEDHEEESGNPRQPASSWNSTPPGKLLRGSASIWTKARALLR